MKPIVPILGIASLLWLCLGTSWLSNQVCSPKNASGFTINDGKFSTSSPDMFSFLLSGERLQFTESTGNSLKAVSKYLGENPNKQLTLTGMYGENEKNKSSYDDLGIARAETVKDFLMKNGAIGDNISTTSLQSDNLYFDEDKRMNGGVNFSIDGDTGGSTTDDEDSSSSTDDATLSGGEMSFAPGASMFLDITDSNSAFTKTESFKNYFAELKSYLGDHPDQKLIVTCYNDDSGLATTITRKVKSIFRKLGLETTSITRKTGKEVDSPSGLPGVNVEIK